MKHTKFWSLLLSSALIFAACDDDNSTPNTDPSGSEENSSKDDPSKDDPSKDDPSKDDPSKDDPSKDDPSKDDPSKDDPSKDDPSKDDPSKDDPSKDQNTDLRAATLADLEKNYELKLFDQTVYLSTGSKQGLIALRIPDELWIITYTDFANGEVTFNKDNSGQQNADTDAAKKITGQLSEGFKLSFRIDKEGKILYAVNGSNDYSEAIKASVAVQKNKVSKADDIKDKIYTCTADDQTQVFRFFDGTYIFENIADEKVSFWQAGHYDIQRSTLLMRPAYFNQPAESMYVYSVGTDNTIVSSQDGSSVTMNCNVEASEYEYEKASDFVGDWVATRDGNDWKFSLKADGTFELTAHKGETQVDSKSGDWEIYGYHMMLRNKNCLHPETCTPGIHGQLQTGPIDRDTGKISGFSFIHSDSNKPAMPTSFDAPELAGN